MNRKIFVTIIVLLVLFLVFEIRLIPRVNADSQKIVSTEWSKPVDLNPTGTEVKEKEGTETGEITQGTLKGKTDKGEEIECPLKHTDVKADVSGFISSVEVTQEFTNPFDKPIEATYIFPLPHNAAVNSMEMKVGERTILGLIKTKEEARQIYETAKKEGQLTGLLEQERPNIFTQSVANIKPGDTILVKIKYVDILDYDKGIYEFVFPMVVGPRYNPASVQDPEKITPQYLKPGQRNGHDISLELHLDAGVPIQDIKCKSHSVTLQTGGKNEALIKIKPEDSIPNKDFILQYDVAGEKPEVANITTGRGGNGYFTLMIQPKANYNDAEITPKEMVFVLDCSGSMSGEPIETSKAAIRKCIKFMNKNDTFQIITFSLSASGLSSKPLPNTPENIKKGLAYVDSLSGEGGTNMLEGIKAALDFPSDPKRMRIVFFLTDGYIGNESEILAEIEKNIGEARLFSLGIGSSVNRYLLDMMAEAGRGAVQYVRPNSDPTKVVEQFYERISKPYFTDISIDWHGLKVADVYPKKIPDLFSAQPLFIYGRYTDALSANIEIVGKIAGKETKIPLKVEFPKNNEANGALSSIWARQKIKDLEDRQFQGTQPDIVNQITALALEFKLMSNYTSFVAVEKSYKVDANGELQTVIVPVQMPESVSYEGVFGKDGEEKKQSSGYSVNNPVSMPGPSPTSILKPDSDVVATVPPPSQTVISINTENLKVSKNSKSLEVPTGFDFAEYMKNFKEKKSFTRVQILRNGEKLSEIASGTKGIGLSKDSKIINLNFTDDSPFINPGEYTIIIEVYDKGGIMTARGANVISVN